MLKQTKYSPEKLAQWGACLKIGEYNYSRQVQILSLVLVEEENATIHGTFLTLYVHVAQHVDPTSSNTLPD